MTPIQGHVHYGIDTTYIDIDTIIIWCPYHYHITVIHSRLQQSVPVVNFVASFTWECQQEIPAIRRKDFDSNGLQQITSLVDFPHVIKCHLEAPVAYNHHAISLMITFIISHKWCPSMANQAVETTPPVYLHVHLCTYNRQCVMFIHSVIGMLRHQQFIDSICTN